MYSIYFLSSSSTTYLTSVISQLPVKIILYLNHAILKSQAKGPKKLEFHVISKCELT